MAKPLKPKDFKSGWRRRLNAECEKKPVTLPRAPWDENPNAVLVIKDGRTHGPKSEVFKETVRKFNDRD